MRSMRIICVVWCMIIKLVLIVHGEPIKVDFTYCRDSVYPLGFLPNASTVTYKCCPPLPKGPILDGIAPPTPSVRARVRPAYQCTDEVYRKKLRKGYDLMRALPDDDPRSFTKQWQIHCAYCGGAFTTDPKNGTTAIDIHFGWLFYPWHRYFLYFHERILQKLLDDPTFSLPFWNWDAPFTFGDGSSPPGHCLKAGADFPETYADPRSPLYDEFRSESAKGRGPFLFPDLSFVAFLPAAEQLPSNLTADDLVASNLNVMYTAMVSGGTTAPIFLGRAYRAGDLRGTPTPNGGGGILEGSAHAGVHLWTGMDPPFDLRDMGGIVTSSRDPSFYAHHANIDRLFHLWKEIGPILGVERQYWTDPDFLNAEFLFYDENRDVRRVLIKDSLDIKNFGYVYEDTILPWLNLNVTSCSSSSYNDILATASKLPVPIKDSDGTYHLVAGTAFVMVLNRPQSPRGREEFLTVSDIALDRCKNGGFDVFVNFLNPSSVLVPTKCAEYVGRFSNMAVAESPRTSERTFTFTTSITQTLVDVPVPAYARQLVVTIVPMSPKGGVETITFKDVYISDKDE